MSPTKHECAKGVLCSELVVATVAMEAMREAYLKEKQQAARLAGALSGATEELAGNLEEWAEHFRKEQHGATLTLLRAAKVIRDQRKELAAYEGGGL